MSRNTGKRVNLPLKRKIDLIEAFEDGTGRKRKDIAREFGISPSCVTRILSEKEELKTLFCSGTVDSNKQRPNRVSLLNDVDNALHVWFKIARDNGIPISCSLMKMKAEEIAYDLGFVQWTCSSGWLERFNKRHGITLRKGVGVKEESVDDETPEETPETWMQGVLLPTLARYHEKDVFNMEEFGLFWRVLPDQTMAFKSEKCCDGKQSKERVTVALCANMDGTEKRPLLVIGKFDKPRCLKGIKELPVLYAGSPKAWMTTALFEKWLLSFDQDMDSRGRRVLLVVKDCPAHVVFLDLRATELLFLPPHVTSRFSPMHTGVIKNIKFCYRTRMLSRLIQHLDQGSPCADFSFTLYDAIHSIKKAWENVETSTIKNCFRKAGFNLSGDSEEVASELGGEEEVDFCHAELEPILSRLNKELGVSMDEFCDFDKDVATCAPSSKKVSQKAASSEAAHGHAEDTSCNDGGDSDEDDIGDEPPTISKHESLSALSTLELYLAQAGCSDDVRAHFDQFSNALEHSLLMNDKEQSKVRCVKKTSAAQMKSPHTRIRSLPSAGADILTGYKVILSTDSGFISSSISPGPS